MAQTLSTSSSKHIRSLWVGAVILWFTLLATWFLYGGEISESLAAQFGESITSATKGKVRAADLYLHRIFRDILLLSATGMGLLYWILRVFRSSRFSLWVLTLLLLPNLLFFVLSHTVLYWTAMQAIPLTDSNFFGRYQLKKSLYHLTAREVDPVLIMGSSQPRAQIDEELLNDLLPEGHRVYELCYPGSCLYDLPYVFHSVRSAPPKTVILYLTELDLYAAPQASRTVQVIEPTSIPYLLKPGAAEGLSIKDRFYAGLGTVFPLFRQRQFLTELLLGQPWQKLEKKKHADRTLAVPREERIRQRVERYKAGAPHPSNIQGLNLLVDLTREHGTQLFIVRGMLHADIDNALRAESITVLDELLEAVGVQDHVTVYDHRDTHPQAASEYMDFTHIEKEAQKRFTRHLAEKLRERYSGQSLTEMPQI